MKLTEILQAHNVPFKTSGHHHCTKGFVQVDCPWCSGTGAGKWRMGINTSYLNANCWKCGPKSTRLTLAVLCDLPVTEVGKMLDGIVREVVRDEVKVNGTLLVPFTTFRLDQSPHHWSYLCDRGFDPHQVEKLWDVQAVKIHSEFGWRLYIPIYLRGEVVSWTTRAINEETKAKYVTAKPLQEKIHCKKILYGEDYARNAVVVVEGPTDVWRVGPGAVATLGTGYNSAQVRRIARYPKRVVCFDNEAEAQTRAQALADELAVYPGETINVQLDAKDPGSASAKEIERLRNLAFN